MLINYETPLINISKQGFLYLQVDSYIEDTLQEWVSSFLMLPSITKLEDELRIIVLPDIDDTYKNVENVVLSYPRNDIVIDSVKPGVFACDKEDKEDVIALKISSVDLQYFYQLSSSLHHNPGYVYSPYITLAYAKRKEFSISEIPDLPVELKNLSFSKVNYNYGRLSAVIRLGGAIEAPQGGDEVEVIFKKRTPSRASKAEVRYKVQIQPEFFDITDVEDAELEDVADVLALARTDVLLEKNAGDSTFVKGSSIKASAGQILINDELPKSMRDYTRVLNKKNLKGLFQQLADEYPDEYKKVGYGIRRLSDTEGLYAMQHLSYDDFSPPIKAASYIEKAKKKYENARKTKPEDEALATSYSLVKNKMNEDVITEGVKKNNVLSLMAYSGAKGKPSQVADTIVAPMLVSDYKNKPIPIIIDKSYTEGLTPAQYWAQSYGTRRGLISTKLAVPLAGYMSKMLGWSMGGTIVSEEDCGTNNGVSYRVTDSHNIGKLLAKPIGKYGKDTVMNPKILSDLARAKKNIILRSPITCESEVGVCSKCMGIIETGKLAQVGYDAGIVSSSTLSEPLSQNMLSEKHTGGSIKEKIGGFPLISRLVEIPKEFQGKAVLSENDGKITNIRKAPWGGSYITVGDVPYYANADVDPIVKENSIVERGEPLTGGIISTAEKTRLRGIGEGRIQLSNDLQGAYEEMGADKDRVHFELAARSFVNFGRVGGKSIGKNLPGDVASLASLMRSTKFDDVTIINTSNAKSDNYLAKPELHYTIGTALTTKIKRDLIDNGIKKVSITHHKLDFTPLMVRIQDTAAVDKDWMSRLSSQGLKKGILEAAHRGLASRTKGSKFVHPYILGVNFGKGKYF